MLKTSEIDMVLAHVVKLREKELIEKENGVNLYTELQRVNVAKGANPDDDLPPEAYKAVSNFIETALISLARSANTQLADLLEMINGMPLASADIETIDKLKDVALKAATGYLFTLSLCRAALKEADYGYLAEVALEAGKQAASTR